ncbi:MAG TPA: hypothetical protein VFS91_11915, partial [Nitrobacter sp.]|nr:hypothetical protein [Nitrobacter sp.]
MPQSVTEESEGNIGKLALRLLDRLALDIIRRQHRRRDRCLYGLESRRLDLDQPLGPFLPCVC